MRIVDPFDEDVEEQQPKQKIIDPFDEGLEEQQPEQQGIIDPFEDEIAAPAADVSEPSLMDLELGIGAEEKEAPVQAPEVETPMQSVSDVEFGSFYDTLGMQADVPIEKEDEFKINFEELSTDDFYFKSIKNYMEARYGEQGEQQEGESKEDYVNRFARHARGVQLSTMSIPGIGGTDAVSELVWITNASEEDKQKAGMAFAIWDSTPAFWKLGGQGGVAPALQATGAVLTDMTTYLGIGVGKALSVSGTRKLTEEALKAAGKGRAAQRLMQKVAASKSGKPTPKQAGQLQRLADDLTKFQSQRTSAQLKGAGIVAGAEGVVGAGAAAIDEQLAVERGDQEEISGTAIGVNTLLSATFGAVEGFAFSKPAEVSYKQKLSARLAARRADPDFKAKQKVKRSQQEEQIIQMFNEGQESLNSMFNPIEGRRILDKQSPEGVLVQAQIKKDITQKAVDIAKYIMLTDVEKFGPRADETIGDAVYRVIAGLAPDGDIDKVTFERAATEAKVKPTEFVAALRDRLQEAGMSEKEFAEAARTTLGDAASTMARFANLTRVVKKFTDIDPEAEQLLRKSAGYSNPFGRLFAFVQRAERESKALVTSALVTTVRNGIGTAGAITLDTASNIFEGLVLNTSRVVDSAMQKDIRGFARNATVGYVEEIKDAFTIWGKLYNVGMTAEESDLILKGSPKFKDTLFSALQETGNQQLSGLSRFFNKANVAQDAYFRRAIFVAAVERRLKSVGLKMDDILAAKKTIPSSVLEEASEDALKMTFSYMPKAKGFSSAGLPDPEKGFETLGNAFVRGMEWIPTGSLAVTFPRFMANAIAFQYRYSPLGATSGLAKMGHAAYRFSKTNAADALDEFDEGLSQLSKGTIGIALLYGAYEHRKANQDTLWYEYKKEDGSTGDMRGLFPLAPYLAVADFIVKKGDTAVGDEKVSDALQAMVGIKIPSGTQGFLIDQIATALSGEDGKTAARADQAIGRVISDFLGRPFQAVKPIAEFFELFRRESTVARDPNVLDFREDSPILETIKDRLANKIPILKEDLPEVIPYLRGETPRRPASFFTSLTGVNITARRNEIEQEFLDLTLEPFKFFPRTAIKEYDRAVIASSLEHVERMVTERMNRADYANLSTNERRLAIKATMRDAVSTGRDIARAQFNAEDRLIMDKLEFDGLSAEERSIINKKYQQDKAAQLGISLDKAPTLEQDKAYDRYYWYLGALQLR